MKSFKAKPGYYWLLYEDISQDIMFIVYPDLKYDYLDRTGHCYSADDKPGLNVQFGTLPWHKQSEYLGPL